MVLIPIYTKYISVLIFLGMNGTHSNTEYVCLLGGIMVFIPILIMCAYLEEYGTHSNTEEVCLFGVIWYSFQY